MGKKYVRKLTNYVNDFLYFSYLLELKLPIVYKDTIILQFCIHLMRRYPKRYDVLKRKIEKLKNEYLKTITDNLGVLEKCIFKEDRIIL